VGRALGIAWYAFVLAAGSLLATWSWRSDFDSAFGAAVRLALWGTTTVDDFRRWPGNDLAPSASPRLFPRRAQPAPPPEVELLAGKRQPLAAALESTRTLAFLVLRDGEIVFEWGGEGRAPREPSQWFSVSKSVLATLVAMAVDDGILASVSQPVTDLVPELAPHGFGAVTLRHLLDMTSGIDYDENDNPFGEHVLMNYTPSIERQVLGFRLAEPPGTRWSYKSGDTALLSLALRRALAARRGPGTTLTAYAQARLWTPLGMEHPGTWSVDQEGGLEKAWCCLAGSARDLARIGLLYLARGAPGGTRLLAQRWADEAFAPMPDAGEWRAHRFSWWSARPQAQGILAIGKDGQFLHVDPARRTIIVRLGRSQGDAGVGRWAALFETLAAHPW